MGTQQQQGSTSLNMPLMVRYTRNRENGEAFFTTVNVLMMEVMKLAACSFLLIREHKCIFKFLADVKDAIWGDPVETAKVVCFPAVIYTLQNNLYYIALSHLDATTFCILYQLKIFTTALLMRVLLNRRLSSYQWFALCLLVVGAADVEWSSASSEASANSNDLVGLLSVGAMCFTSAIAGVYLEKVLKGSSVSVWMQNIRISLIGLPVSILSMCYYEWSDIQRDGPFRGWDHWVLIMTATNSLGGLLISMVIKYADNILKAYAQSMAIVGAVVGSWLIFSIVPSIFFMLGAIMVMLSIVVYSAFPYVEKPSEEKVQLMAADGREYI
ncbi:hypothetical protein PRIPAC_70276 [Pristionchus pacificus]|uniref:Uncharacterized protein n=1 Tax=Pristionchus pacificus TaxID=54126 RepID=A0A2A6BZR3_PRIPA|nr:hypothetical protein PRIPAC_70276 [Pristionchus pacificus]|eukprot:PDM71415.1 hypothetical protein PRIPAC_37822 [Pristionchus pacificus]